MGNACGGSSDGPELKVKKYNTEKYNADLKENEDPQVQEAIDMVLDDRDVGGLSGWDKLEYVLKLQARFRHIKRCRRAQKISASNFIRTFSDRVAAGEVEEHTNKAVQEKLQTLGRYKFNNKETDVSVDRDTRDMQEWVESENAEPKIYKGQWGKKSNKPDGYGCMIYPNGQFYEGSFSDGQMSGHGRLIHQDCDVYEGEWQANKANGKGTYTYADGNSYEGDWVDDKQDGQGKEVWIDGAVYEGAYSQGKKNGHGRFDWGDQGLYEGEFKDNKMDGEGTYIWPDQRKFTGQWKENKMHGKGLFTWLDGRTYEGEYVEDKKEGFGIFTWADGKKYEGQWKNGKQHGEGTIT